MKHYLPQISWHNQEAIYSVDFQRTQNGDYIILTAGISGIMRVWEMVFDKHGVLTMNFLSDLKDRHNAAINVARFSPNADLIASGDVNAALCIWHIPERLNYDAPDLFAKEGDPEMPPNKVNWRVKGQLHINRACGSTRDITDLAWSACGELLCVLSLDKSAVVYNVKEDKKLKVITDFKQFANGVAFSPSDPFMATLSNDRELRIFSTTTFKCVRRISKCTLPGVDKENAEREFRLLHDDQLASFTRRLQYSKCGQLLFVPAGVIENASSTIYSTYVFTHASHYDRPALVYTTPTASIAVAVSPKVYKLHENLPNPLGLPYRCICAVITSKMLFVFDTQVTTAIARADNMHYANLSDVGWSNDGLLISIASHDGYITFFQFTDGEFGEETTPPSIAEFKPVPLLANNSFVNRAGRRARKDVQKKVMELKEMDTSDTPVANFTPVPAEQTIKAFFAKSKPTTPSRKDQENEPKPKTKRRIVPTALPPVAQ